MRRAFLLWLVIFAAFATTIGLPASPGNDLSESEAQTLLVTESIVSDGDLDLRDEYADADEQFARFWNGSIPLWKQMEPAPAATRRSSPSARAPTRCSRW